MIVSLLLIATDRFHQYHQQNFCHHISLFLITVSKSFLILFFFVNYNFVLQHIFQVNTTSEQECEE